MSKGQAEDEARAALANVASKGVVRAAFTATISATILVSLAMCVLAGLTALLVIWAVPAPGTVDRLTELPWAHDAPARWNPAADYSTPAGCAAAGFALLPSGVALKDVAVGSGAHPLYPGDFMMVYFKMRLAVPERGPPKDAMAAPERFPFVFARATEDSALFAIIGAHGEELLPGVEEGMSGMRARGRSRGADVPGAYADPLHRRSPPPHLAGGRPPQAGGASPQGIRRGGLHAQDWDAHSGGPSQCDAAGRL